MNEEAYRAILRRLGVEPAMPVPMGSPELARRVAAFRQQVEAWALSGRLGVPLLTLPDAPAPQLGHCVSCGEPIPEGRWRCALCLQAVHLALGMEPPRDVRQRGETP